MERTATLLGDLLGCPVSTGFVASCLTRLADKLDGFEADLKDALAGADQLYHDETPVPVNGGTGYVYAARADGLLVRGARAPQPRRHRRLWHPAPLRRRARPRRLGRLPQIQRPQPGREGDRGPAVLRAPDARPASGLGSRPARPGLGRADAPDPDQGAPGGRRRGRRRGIQPAARNPRPAARPVRPVSYTHLRAHETKANL